MKFLQGRATKLNLNSNLELLGFKCIVIYTKIYNSKTISPLPLQLTITTLLEFPYILLGDKIMLLIMNYKWEARNRYSRHNLRNNYNVGGK